MMGFGGFPRELWIVIGIGSLLGSAKAVTTNTTSPRTKMVTLINLLLGIFAGAMVSAHFADRVGWWVVGLIAVAASSLAVEVLEILRKLTPEVLARIILKKTGLDTETVDKNKDLTK